MISIKAKNKAAAMKQLDAIHGNNPNIPTQVILDLQKQIRGQKEGLVEVNYSPARPVAPSAQPQSGSKPPAATPSPGKP